MLQTKLIEYLGPGDIRCTVEASAMEEINVKPPPKTQSTKQVGPRAQKVTNIDELFYH